MNESRDGLFANHSKSKRELPALIAQLAELDERIRQAREDELNDAIAMCREIIETYELTAYDLGLVPTQVIPAQKRVAKTFRPSAAPEPLPPKYRDPATGATWSGRGKAPRWIQDEDRDAFLVR